MDGCQEGFGAILSQRHTTTLPSGNVVMATHPIAYASKRTSNTEEKYKPYLLEFAALKFGLDQFSDIIWGSPVEIETDCQALRDTLLNSKLNTAHARWRDGIVAYHIIDVRHRPGVTNTAADGLSRSFVTREPSPGDGAEWTVNEDWEAARGIVQDLFEVSSSPSRINVPNVQFTELRTRFQYEPLFLEIVDTLCDLDSDQPVNVKRRARHRAQQFFIEDNKLWKIPNHTTTRAHSKLECVSQEEAVELARREHTEHGHWGRDMVKLQLMDQICSPRLNKSITTAMLECGQCKNFGAVHLNALLEPIVRRHPFELFMADYLSMPKSKGGFTDILLIIDTYSQFVWGFRLKNHRTAKSTIAGLESIHHNFSTPETFMTDGGKHFDNEEVKTWCEKYNTKHYNTKRYVTPTYTPWVNGLIEGTNKLLLGRLKYMCAPHLGEDNIKDVSLLEETTNQPSLDDVHVHSAYVSHNNAPMPLRMQ